MKDYSTDDHLNAFLAGHNAVASRPMTREMFTEIAVAFMLRRLRDGAPMPDDEPADATRLQHEIRFLERELRCRREELRVLLDAP